MDRVSSTDRVDSIRGRKRGKDRTGVTCVRDA